MKPKMLKTVRERFQIKYLKGKVAIIDHKEKKVEEFDSINEAISYLVYFFYGMDVHHQWKKRSRFRLSLNKYYNTVSV